MRINYIMRGLSIPAGNHTIEFKFIPKKVILTNTIAFWLSNLTGLIILGLLGWLIMNDYKHWKEELLQKTTVVSQPSPLTRDPVKPKTKKK